MSHKVTPRNPRRHVLNCMHHRSYILRTDIARLWSDVRAYFIIIITCMIGPRILLCMTFKCHVKPASGPQISLPYRQPAGCRTFCTGVITRCTSVCVSELTRKLIATACMASIFRSINERAASERSWHCQLKD